MKSILRLCLTLVLAWYLTEALTLPLNEFENLDDFKNAVEYFEGLDANNVLNDIMRFPPTNMTYWDLPHLLFGNTKISYSYLQGNQLPSKCANLMLEPSFMYHVLRPKNIMDGELAYVNIKFPFSSILASNTLFLGRDYCIAFNLKNYGFGFDLIKEIPAMTDGGAGLHLQSISLSTENKLLIDPEVSLNHFFI